MAEEMAAIVKHHVGTHARRDWLNREGKLGFKCPKWEWGPQKENQLFLKLWKLSATQALSPLESGWERRGWSSASSPPTAVPA